MIIELSYTRSELERLVAALKQAYPFCDDDKKLLDRLAFEFNLYLDDDL